jgi:hypothetical protein
MDRLVSTVAEQTGSAPPDVAAPPELVLADESDVELDADDRDGDGDGAGFDAALLDSSEVIEAPGDEGAAVRYDLDLDFDDEAETIARDEDAPEAWRNAPTLPAPAVASPHASALPHASPSVHAVASPHASALPHASGPAAAIERRPVVTPLRATLDPIRPRRWPLAIAVGAAVLVCSATFAFLVSSGEQPSPAAVDVSAVTTLTTATAIAPKPSTPTAPAHPAATAAAAITPASLPDARDGARPLAAHPAAPSTPSTAAPVMTATLDSLPDAPRR